MKLNDNELAVLKVLAEAYSWDEDFCFSPFAPLMEQTGLDRATVRRACRSLRRKGLTRYQSGLWAETGELSGAGYAATAAGAALVEELP